MRTKVEMRRLSKLVYFHAFVAEVETSTKLLNPSGCKCFKEKRGIPIARLMSLSSSSVHVNSLKVSPSFSSQFEVAGSVET